MKPITSLVQGWRGIPGWLSEVEAAVLEASVLSTDPDTAIVELGTWAGRSLMALAAARARFGQERTRPLVSVDLYPEKGQAQEAAADGMDVTPAEARAIARLWPGRFGVPNVHFRDIDAVEGAGRFHAETFEYGPLKGKRVGLLYIDDDHSGPRVLAELAAWDAVLADECEVCLHDFPHEPYGLEDALDRFTHQHPEWVMLEVRQGMARFRRRWRGTPRAPAVARKVALASDLAWSNPVSGARQIQPKVSVLYNTWRLGGLDCLKIGLDRQTLDPALFEVVIVDALYPYRREVVRDLFQAVPYAVRHLNPTDNPLPRDHGNRARNDAIRAAHGEVLVWWCDYSIAEAESLERHLRKVERFGPRASSCGHIVYGEIDIEALHPLFRAVLPIRTIDDYVDLVEALPADSPLWISIFRDDPRTLGRSDLISVQHGHGLPYELRDKVKLSSNHLVFDCLKGAPVVVVARDMRLEMLNGPSPADNIYYAKNEATPKRALVDVNGWEESFDDGHSCDDLDLSRRLFLDGHSLIVDKGNECFVPNPRPFFPLMRWKRPGWENHRLFETLKALGRTRAIQGLANELEMTRAEIEAATKAREAATC